MLQLFSKTSSGHGKKTAHCDRCGSRMRLSDRKKQISVDIVLSSPEGNPITLTIFQNILQTVITNLANINEDELSETLLSLEDVKVNYNSKSLLVTELHVNI